MLADVFTLSGRIKIVPNPASTDASFRPAVSTDVYEQMPVALHHEDEYDLTADGVQAVSLGGLSSVSMIAIKPSGKVKVILTNADNAAQVVTVDQFMVIMCQGTPYTAISLQRAAGIETNVRLALAQLGT